jgi:ribosome-binding factor A
MEQFNFTLPGLGKPKSSRPARTAEAILHELTILLRQEVRDARLSGVTFANVQMSPDLKLAKVWFHVQPDTDPAVARKDLERARGFFRSHLAKALNLRHTPDLAFYYDRQQEAVERLDQIFTQISKEQPPAEDSE